MCAAAPAPPAAAGSGPSRRPLPTRGGRSGGRSPSLPGAFPEPFPEPSHPKVGAGPALPPPPPLPSRPGRGRAAVQHLGGRGAPPSAGPGPGAIPAGVGVCSDQRLFLCESKMFLEEGFVVLELFVALNLALSVFYPMQLSETFVQQS